MAAADFKRVTQNDVALAAGVSSQTVSRVINNHPYVSEEIRKRVLDAIRQLDYRPNRAARILAIQRSFMLGIITYGIHHYGPVQMMYNVEQTARARGYSVTFQTIPELSIQEIRPAIENFRDHIVDGIVLIAPVAGADYEDLVQLCNGTPLVIIDAELGKPIPSVVIDQREGSRLVTQHLIDLGHQQLCEIHGPLNWFGAMARHESWRVTLLAAGLEPGPCVGGDWTARSGYEAAYTLLNQGAKFTGLVVGNDQMALGAIHALNEYGLRVPDDISVVGFDDVPESAYWAPPLTTIRQNFAALGEQSVEYLVARIENPQTPLHQRLLYPQLIERRSTRPI
ncbi:MAG: LacI family DNA-binding transcriptional regulator [Anaerolineae bacterium]|nr:LacI family DNA-binding transcriptional regulator [Anaerolineae bacterium]